MRTIEIDQYITVKLGETKAFVFSMKVEDLLPMYYVAVRGRDDVEGAVQRVLSKRRISSIKNFILEGNTFFNMFILNWVDNNYPIKIKRNKLCISQVSAGAQVIDGQHRLEGLKQAYDLQIPENEMTQIYQILQKTHFSYQLYQNVKEKKQEKAEAFVNDFIDAFSIIMEINIREEFSLYQNIKAHMLKKQS